MLAQPVCASAAERNWSVYGAIKTHARSGMGHGTADKLVYCHEALHMKQKLQVARYSQEPEKWISDSDSDESDEEDECSDAENAEEGAQNDLEDDFYDDDEDSSDDDDENLIATVQAPGAPKRRRKAP